MKEEYAKTSIPSRVTPEGGIWPHPRHGSGCQAFWLVLAGSGLKGSPESHPLSHAHEGGAILQTSSLRGSGWSPLPVYSWSLFWSPCPPFQPCTPNDLGPDLLLFVWFYFGSHTQLCGQSCAEPSPRQTVALAPRIPSRPSPPTSGLRVWVTRLWDADGGP